MLDPSSMMLVRAREASASPWPGVIEMDWDAATGGYVYWQSCCLSWCYGRAYTDMAESCRESSQKKVLINSTRRFLLRAAREGVIYFAK